MILQIAPIELIIIRRALMEYKQQLTQCGDLPSQLTADYIDGIMQQITPQLQTDEERKRKP